MQAAHPRGADENSVDVDKTYFDVPRLRSAYPSRFPFVGHRLRVPCPPRYLVFGAVQPDQWWFPIYPVEADNAMAFYPDYFDRPVKNNSEIYNYYEWNTNRGERRQARQERHARAAKAAGEDRAARQSAPAAARRG